MDKAAREPSQSANAARSQSETLVTEQGRREPPSPRLLIRPGETGMNDLIEAMERAFGIVAVLDRPTRSEIVLAKLIGAGAKALREQADELSRLQSDQNITGGWRAVDEALADYESDANSDRCMLGDVYANVNVSALRRLLPGGEEKR